MDDWDDMANIWNRNWDHMEVEPTPFPIGEKRGRSRSRTPATRKRSDRAPSRARGMQPRKLTFSSVRTRSRSRSSSEPRKKALWGKAEYFAARKNLPSNVVEAMWRNTAQGKRNQATLNKLKTRKVRHKLTRNLIYMPRYTKRRTTTRRKPYKARKGAYRGALLPRFMKGETKHILSNDQCIASNDCPAGRYGNASANTESGIVKTGGTNDKESFHLRMGEMSVHTLNPITQGTSPTQRNGRSVDGTYLRIQGHIHNQLKKEDASGNTIGTDNGRAYVRMLVLAIKGKTNSAAGGTVTNQNPEAGFNSATLFKKIDGSVVGWDDTTNNGAGTARVRSLQLPINRGDYTVLADMKHELSAIDEGFGASDRMFDKKIKLKQRTTWTDSFCDKFEKNHLVLVTMVVDPIMRDGKIGLAAQAANSDATPPTVAVPAKGIALEFESKYSYKDF